MRHYQRIVFVTNLGKNTVGAGNPGASIPTRPVAMATDAARTPANNRPPNKQLTTLFFTPQGSNRRHRQMKL